jgi:hypothetical protein
LKGCFNAESTVNIIAAQKDLYAAVVDEKVALKLGSAPWNPDEQDRSLYLEGPDLAVWVR